MEGDVMHSGAPRDVNFSRLLGLVLVLAPTLPCLVPPAHAQANECLVQFRGLTGIDTG